MKHLFSTFVHVPLPQSTGVETVVAGEAVDPIGVVDTGCCVGVEPDGTINIILCHCYKNILAGFSHA